MAEKNKGKCVLVELKHGIESGTLNQTTVFIPFVIPWALGKSIFE